VAPPQQQAEALDHRRVLRQVQHVQERSLGFGDRDSGVCLVKFSWTAIRRHVPVKGAASPDDPALAAYWAERRKKVNPNSQIVTSIVFKWRRQTRSAATTR